MIQINISLEMLDRARTKASSLGSLRNSITNGDGNLIGFLGEEIAHSVLGGYINNSYDYDIVLDDGMTVDVKTKKTSVPPKDHYECSVAAFNTKQQCDMYCFVRVKSDLSCGWFLGTYNKEAYYKDAVLLKKGDVDLSNNFIVKANCYNMKISDLNGEYL